MGSLGFQSVLVVGGALEVGWWNIRTCAGEVAGVVAAGGLGSAGVDGGGDEEGEESQEGCVHVCD